MDSPDLLSLLQHFDHKINRVERLIPWARTCNLLVQQYDARISGQPDESQVEQRPLPDLIQLTQLVRDMQNGVSELQQHMKSERDRLDKQKRRVNILIEDVNSHLDYISSNFPLSFGKTTEKPAAPKYGIGVPKRKPVAPATTTTIVRTAAAPKPNAKANAASKTQPTAVKPKPTAVTRVTNNNNNNKQSVQNGTVKKNGCEQMPPKTPAPTVLAGPALVVGKNFKPAIPVRMTKKFETRYNHNVNKR